MVPNRFENKYPIWILSTLTTICGWFPINSSCELCPRYFFSSFQGSRYGRRQREICGEGGLWPKQHHEEGPLCLLWCPVLGTWGLDWEDDVKKVGFPSQFKGTVQGPTKRGSNCGDLWGLKAMQRIEQLDTAGSLCMCSCLIIVCYSYIYIYTILCYVYIYIYYGACISLSLFHTCLSMYARSMQHGVSRFFRSCQVKASDFQSSTKIEALLDEINQMISGDRSAKAVGTAGLGGRLIYDIDQKN